MPSPTAGTIPGLGYNGVLEEEVATLLLQSGNSVFAMLHQGMI